MTTQTTERTLVKISKPIISPAIIEALTNLVAKGNYNITACNIVGITERTFYDWWKHGEQDTEAGIETLYSSLFQSLKNAEAKSESEMMERVRGAALPGVKSKETTIGPDGSTTIKIHETGGDWLAGATYLERRHRERWGRPAPIQVNVDQSKTVQISHVEIVLSETGRQPSIEGESRELIE